MADSTLTSLTGASTLDGTELLYAVQGGADRKATVAQVKTWASNSPTLVTPDLGVAEATSINKVAFTAPATAATLTIPDGVTLTGPASSGTAMTLGNAETVTGAKTFGAAGNVGKLIIAGTSSVSTILDATAAASGTLTLPAATDTLVGKATTDTLTNKTFDANGTGNSLSNIEVADFAAAAVVIESEGLASSDNDTSFPTTAAVIDYVSTGYQPLDSDLTAVAALTTSAAGLSTLTIADPGADRIVAWDDTAGAMAAIALADITAEASPATGDYALIYGAEGDLRKVDWADLPGAAGGISNVVEDTTPQLGGQLDVNGNALGDGTLELLKFEETASAVNEVTVVNAATGDGPTVKATGDDTNVDLNLTGKGTGKVKVDGNYPVGQGKHTVWIPASAMIARTTNGAASGTAEMTTNKNMVKTLDFDATTQEFGQFEIAMPKSWDEGTVTFQPVWSHASTTTNFGVVWALQGVATSDDDTLDVAFGTEQTSTDTGGTTNDRYIGPESSAITIGGTPAEGDVVQFQVKRVVSDGSDTMAIDARLHGVKLYITLNAATDA